MKSLKKECLENIYADYAAEFCGRQIVYGSGDLDSGILFIGEAPGREELHTGRPFVGKAGAKLSSMLDKLGLDRDDVYITNTIKYGLRKTDPETGRTSNRPAKKEEMVRNRPYLLKEIGCIAPKVTVTLGGVPLKTLLHDYEISVSSYAGKLTAFEDHLLFPLFHPAALIYNPALADDFDRFLADLKRIISEILYSEC